MHRGHPDPLQPRGRHRRAQPARPRVRRTRQAVTRPGTAPAPSGGAGHVSGPAPRVVRGRRKAKRALRRPLFRFPTCDFW
ncbi:hypothetical protein WU86_08430 [Corynebacterium xerosis]|nr:hypothetical protein WU86_08430 [Corynebacterium xerosis]